MSSPDTNAEEIVEESTEPQEELIVDDKREAFVDSITQDLGSSFIDSHIDPEIDVWIRVTQEAWMETAKILFEKHGICLLYTSPSPRDATLSRMPSSA